MKNKKQIFYSMTLIMMIVVTIYQTQRLWFGAVSNHSFFYSSTTFNEKGIDEFRQHKIVEPWKIYISAPKEANNVRFYLLNNNPYFYKTYEQSMNLLKETVKLADKIVEEDLSEETLWNNKGVVYDFPYKVTQEVLIQELGIDKVLGYENVVNINHIFIVPAESDATGTQIKCYFINYVDHKTYSIYLDNSTEIKKRNDQLIDTLGDTVLNQPYISTSSDKINRFAYNNFLPETSTMPTLMKMQISNPYMHANNKINYEKLDEDIYTFFKYPDFTGKIENKENNSFVYGDEKITVKYKKEGVMEYIQTLPESSVEVSISQGYAIAKSFLDQDQTLHGDTYLADYGYEGKDLVYYFNYRYNDIPFRMSNVLREQLGFDYPYPIKIVIKNDKVRSYRRYVLESSININSFVDFNDNYINALDRLLKNNPELKEEKITDMYLAYKQEYLNSMPQINWVIETKKHIYYEKIIK